MLQRITILLLVLGIAVYATRTASDSRKLDSPSPHSLRMALDSVRTLDHSERALAAVITSKNTHIIARGPAQWGRTGDFVLKNERITLTIQNVGQGRGLFISGGHLVDADVVRSDNEEGGDRFREIFPVVDFRVPVTTAVEVLNNGNNGQAAVIRVHGEDGLSGTLEFLDILGGTPSGLTYETEYELLPNRNWVRIRTTVYNPTDHTMTGLFAGDFLGMGAREKFFTAATGFDKPIAFSKTKIIGQKGDRVSYAYVIPKQKLILPAGSQEPGAGAFSERALVVPAGGKTHYTRYLVVDRTLDQVLATANRIWGVKLRQVSGKVEDRLNRPVSGAEISLFSTVDPHIVSQSMTNESGRFSLSAPKGQYQLRVTASGRIEETSPDFVLNKSKHIEFLMDAPAQLQLHFSGPVKITAENLDPRMDYPRRLVRYSATGRGPLPLAPGFWKVTASRGMDYELHSRNLMLSPGTELDFGETLVRAIHANSKHWLASDLHQHTVGSPDGENTLEEQVIQNAAEGCELAVISDHDRISDPRPSVQALNLPILALPGIEISPSSGHINAFPLEPGALNEGGRIWANQALADVMNHLSEMHTQPFVMINHPRTSGMGAFQELRTSPFEPYAPGRFDAIEVSDSLGGWRDFLSESDARIERTSRAGGQIPVMLDWFGWLNAGHFVTGLGTSDSHKAAQGTCHPRSYVWTGDQEATVSTVVDSLRNQQAVVARGLFIDLSVNGSPVIGYQNRLRIKRGSLVPLRVKVEAPSWVNAEWLTLYSMGRPLAFVKSGRGWVQSNSKHAQYVIPIEGKARSGTRFDARISVNAKQDAWFVVVSGGTETPNPVFTGAPFAFTNPVYLDVGSDGYRATSARPDTNAAISRGHAPRIAPHLSHRH